jgi:hypothetical protein
MRCRPGPDPPPDSIGSSRCPLCLAALWSTHFPYSPLVYKNAWGAHAGKYRDGECWQAEMSRQAPCWADAPRKNNHLIDTLIRCGSPPLKKSNSQGGIGMMSTSSPLVFGSWVYFLDPRTAHIRAGIPVHWGKPRAPGTVGVHVMDSEVGATLVYLAGARTQATPIYRLGGNLFTHGT